MNNDELLKTVKEKAEKWLGPQYDEETRKVVKEMLEAEDKTPLIDAFYKDLEFGTGGCFSFRTFKAENSLPSFWFFISHIFPTRLRISP